MFFVFSKVLLHLILPLSFILILLTTGLLIIKYKRRGGVIFIGAGFLLLYGLSIGPVSDALIIPLETRYPPLKERDVHADAIVVLTGGVRDLSRRGLESEPSEISLERLVKGVVLYRVLRMPVIISGGTGSPDQSRASEADALVRAALDLGVLKKDLVIENKSRNTRESAHAVKDVLTGNRIILVTSAFHMKRSVALFRKQGFEVIPAPAGNLGERRQLTLFSFIPSAGNLYLSSLAVAEYISFGWYSMTGDL